jgi:hypothetical protein
MILSDFLWSVEYQWFLIELSVLKIKALNSDQQVFMKVNDPLTDDSSDLPGSNFAISVQRFPYFRCAIDIALSSASVHGSFRMDGSS